MALVPLIQPPIIRALTTEAERKIEMVQLREVSQREKILFPLMLLLLVALFVPSAAPLLACLLRELDERVRRCSTIERYGAECADQYRNHLPRLGSGVKTVSE